MEGRLMSELKNYNIFALEGDKQTNDMEVCETLGLDPKVAFTPAINEAAINKMHKENYNEYINRGVSELKAAQLADSLAATARLRVKQALKGQ